MVQLCGKTFGVRFFAVACGLLICLVLLGYYFVPGTPDTPPQNVIGQALLKTQQTESYEYTIRKYTLINGKQQLDSEVYGRKQSDNHIHIKGEVFGSELDFYQIGDTSYTKDQLTGEWIKITDRQLNQQEIFMGELNPLANFAYKELDEAKFEGVQKLEAEKYLVYTARPIINNPYMEILWKGFGYKFWLDRRSLRIYRAEVTALSKNNPSDKLNLVIEFSNYNGNIKISPPE